MPRLRLLIAEPTDFSAAALQRLSTAFEVSAEAPGDLRAAMHDFDAVWIRLGHRISANILTPGQRCRHIVTPVTGLDHVDLAACAASGVSVLSLRGEVDFLRNVRATAELTLGLALALMRHIPAAATHVLRGEWNRDLFRGHELHDRTAGIVGFGRLGTLVAGYLKALGMKVIAHDPFVEVPPHLATATQDLDVLLRHADIVSLHVSYGPATHHLIGAAQLSQLRPHAVLVNTSRGAVVSGDDLLAALEAGVLAGAALDVLENEHDPSARHALVEYARKHDNLLLVPHIGGNTYESFEKTELFMADKLISAIGGAAP